MNGVNGIMPPVGQLPQWSTVNRPPVGTSNPNLGTGYLGFNTTLGALEYYNGTAWIVIGGAPTVQKFLSGTAQTYTPTAGMVRIRVRMVGGGGGGGAQTTGAGAVGTDSSFGSWTAIHGNGGLAASTSPSAGGTGGANGTGTLIVRVDGQNGVGQPASGAAVQAAGGPGGITPFGGGAFGQPNGGGLTPKANTGGGGSGGGSAANAAGAGGAAGEYVEFWMTAAQVGASQTYTVGAGGAAGAGAGNSGGAGAAGIIIIEEFYQ